VSDNPIIGAWHLVGYEVPDEPPERRYPLGRVPAGQLLYSPDGYMAVSYMAGDRPRLAATSWLVATDAERLAAASSYGGYAGRYEWLGDRVVHHVDTSIYPNWIGAALVRLVTFDDADMVFRATETRPDGPPTPVLRWRRRG
jgi:hypothetical protein